MSQNSWSVLLFTLILQLTGQAHANFGFVTDFNQMPKAMQNQASRVFMVFSKKKDQPVGTAYLIHNDGVTALFATAKHVILKPEIQRWSDDLDDLTLLQKARWQNGVDAKLTHEMQLKVDQLSVLTGQTKDWKFSGDASDVGLIKTASSPQLPMVNLDNLGFSIRNKMGSLNKKQHFILGYPVLYVEENGSKFATVQLSLSLGQVSQEVPKREKFLLESTADSRSGNSGSPVFSSEGQLLGILSGGGRPRDYVRYPLMNSRIVPIDYLKIHLGNYLLKRKSNILSCTRVLQN